MNPNQPQHPETSAVKLICTTYWTKTWADVYATLQSTVSPAQVVVLDASDYMVPRRGRRPTWPSSNDGGSLKVYQRNDAPKSLKLQNPSPSLEAAIASSYRSLFRNDKPMKMSPLYSMYRSSVLRNSGALSQDLQSAISETHPDEIFIPNGRLPHEVVLAEKARQLGISVRFFEVGWFQDRLFLSHHPPQFLPAIQSQMRAVNLDKSANFEAAHNWFKLQTSPNGSQNPFNLQVDKVIETERLPKGAKVIFFSSQDEFASTELSGRKFDQETSVGEFVAKCFRNGESVVVKTHPNMLSKSWSMFLREIRYLRRLQLLFRVVVVPHHWGLDLQSLCRYGHEGVVSWSTTGLEYAYLGGKITMLADSFYRPWLESTSVAEASRIHAALQAIERRRLTEFPLMSRWPKFVRRRHFPPSLIESVNFAFLIFWKISRPARKAISWFWFGRG